ncbi:hypothetical protein [Streptomyces canus]|uniref:hypothetical protein n=1 Tax=Streptomyces canus TaxID=58343 RepID=UPI002E261CF5
MIQTTEAAAILYVGMPLVPSYGEPGSYTCARLITQAFANWDLPVASAAYEETAQGWRLVLVLHTGPAVRVELDGSGRRTEVTVTVDNGPALPVHLPMGEGWEPKAARIAREAWRAID